MLASTTYHPGFRDLSGVSHVPDSPPVETFSWGKHLLDALGVVPWQAFRQTSGYRWRGEDTLNAGDLDDWIQINWVRCLVESYPKEEDIDICLRQYGVLRDIIRSANLQKLEERYSFRDGLAVRRFLLTYPHLIEVLLEAYPHLVKHFGPDPQVALEVISDPEVEGWAQLFAYIITSLPVDEALVRLDTLDREWFLDQLDQVDGLFNFNLEIV